MAGEAQIPRGLIDLLQREGTESQAGFSAYRKLGGNISSNIWQKVWGEVENERSLGAIDTGQPLSRKPSPESIIPMTTKRATGYLQKVSLIMTEANGEAITKVFDYSTKTLLSRGNVIRKAITIMEESNETGSATEKYPEREIKVGLYSGTYEMNPA